MSDLRLIEAIQADNLSVVKELIASGADIHQQDEQGWTPLNWAAGKGNIEIVKLLVENGADVFNVGRDARTPYLIALAAGHAEVVKYLRRAEERVEGRKPSRPEQQYCKAYHMADLRRFPAWSENRINWKDGKNNGESADGKSEAGGFSDSDVVFLHQDYTVTYSMWRNENVVFDQVSPEWEDFCTRELQFKIPDDLDLIPSAA